MTCARTVHSGRASHSAMNIFSSNCVSGLRAVSFKSPSGFSLLLRPLLCFWITEAMTSSTTAMATSGIREFIGQF